MKKLFNFAKGKKESSISRRSITSLESLPKSQNGGYDIGLSEKDKNFNKLHRACWLGDVEKARKHANNFDVNAKDRENRTPLHLACAQGHQDVVLVLLGHKANVNITDANGLTPLLKAVECEQVNIVKFLLERKVNPNAFDKDGNTGLHLAAKYGNLDIGLLFLQWKVNPNALNKEGQTALHIAVKHRHIDIAQSLLDAGTDINIQDIQLRSPLIIVCQEGFIELVRMLLNYNADVTLKDSLGWTAEDCADMAEHRDCARLIKQKFTIDKEDSDLEPEPIISTHNKSNDRDDEENSLNVDSWDDNADTDNQDKMATGINQIKSNDVENGTMALSAGISKFQMSLSDDSISENSFQHDNIASKPIDATSTSQNKEEAILNPNILNEDEESSWDSEKLESNSKVLIPEPQIYKVVDDDKEKINVAIGAHRADVNKMETAKAAAKDVMAELGLSDVSSGDGDESTGETSENDFKIGDFLPNFALKSQSEPNLLEVGSHLDKENLAEKNSAVSTTHLTGSVQTLYVDLKKNDDDISNGSNWDDSEADKQAGTVHIKPILAKSDNELKSNNSLSRTENSLETSFKRFGSGMDISTDGTLGRDGTMQGVDEIWEENPRLVIDSKIEEQKKQTEVSQNEQSEVTVNEIESGQHLAVSGIENNDFSSKHSNKQNTSIHKDSTKVDVALPTNQIPHSIPLLQSDQQKTENSLGGDSNPILNGIIENLRFELDSERKMRRIIEAEVKTHSSEKQELLRKIEESHFEKLNSQKQLAQLEIEIGSLNCLQVQKQTCNTQLEQIKSQLDQMESKYNTEVKEKQKVLNENQKLLMEIENVRKSLETEQQTKKFTTRNFSTQTLLTVENDKSNNEIVQHENSEDIARIERQLSESISNFRQQEEYLCSTMKNLEADSKLLKDHIQELIEQNNKLTSGMNNIAKQSADKDALIKIAHEKMLNTETEKHKIELEAKQHQAKISELEYKMSSMKLNEDALKCQTSGLSNVLDKSQEKSEAMFKDLQYEILKVVSALNVNNSTVTSKLQQLEDKVTETDALQSLNVKQEIDRIVNIIMEKSKATDTENHALMKDIDTVRKEKTILEQTIAEKELHQMKLAQELHALQNQNFIMNNMATQTVEEISNIHFETGQQIDMHSLKQITGNTMDFTAQCSLTEACDCNSAGVSNHCLKEPLDKLNSFLLNQMKRQETIERLHGEKISSNQLHSTLVTQGLKESIERLQEQLRLKETHKIALQQQVFDLRILASTALQPKLPSPERKHRPNHHAKSRNAQTQRHRSPLRSSPPSVSWSMPSGPPLTTSTPLRPKLNTDYLDPNLRLQLERCIDKYLSTGAVSETAQRNVLTSQVMTKDDTSLTCYIAALKSKYDL